MKKGKGKNERTTRDEKKKEAIKKKKKGRRRKKTKSSSNVPAVTMYILRYDRTRRRCKFVNIKNYSSPSEYDQNP